MTFNLSVGSMLGVAAMMFSYTVTRLGWPVLPSLALVAFVAIVVGLTNGILVIKTGLPSFIVTLATLYILRGATIALTSLVTNNTQIQGVNDKAGGSPLHVFFNSYIGQFPISVVWWVVLALVAFWVLRKTSFGNWTYATGGDLNTARNVGVPVDRVRVLLYICCALAAALVAVIQVIETNSADVGQGTNVEFQAVTASVIGGTLLTGGYGWRSAPGLARSRLEWSTRASSLPTSTRTGSRPCWARCCSARSRSTTSCADAR